MSLDAPYDDQNVFARIIRGELPAAKVFEDDRTLAFMDAFPQSEGHTLVVAKDPKAVNLLDIPADALAHLATQTQRVARAVADALKPDGFRLVQFNGAPAGQSVFHLHFHIVPIWSDRSVGGHGEGQADADVLENLAEKIRAKL